MDRRPVRLWSLVLRRDLRRRVQTHPAPHRSGPQAVARLSRLAVLAERSRPPPSRQSIGWPRSDVWTCRRHSASAHRVSCAWVISVLACPAPPQRSRGNADLRITQRLWSHPSTAWSRSPGMGGRDQSERLVAINWNQWSQSAGTRRFRYITTAFVCIFTDFHTSRAATLWTSAISASGSKGFCTTVRLSTFCSLMWPSDVSPVIIITGTV